LSQNVNCLQLLHSNQIINFNQFDSFTLNLACTISLANNEC